MFMIGNRIGVKFEKPQPTHFPIGSGKYPEYITVGDAIMDLVGKEKNIPNHIPLEHKPLVAERYAHFYLSDYCDYGFGIRIAERLINLDSVKAQQNVSHGGKLSKTHIDYLSNSTLSYRGGEIPTYIKGDSINEDVWGKSIHCGTSAQFKWEEKPLELGEKLALLDQVYNSESTVSLPRLIALDSDKDADKINELFAVMLSRRAKNVFF